MKNFAIVLFVLTVVYGCQSSSSDRALQQTKKIIVYGSVNCDHCVDFKAQLDSIGFTYDFKDVEFNETLANEMVQKVQTARISGNISFPVIDVEGNIMVAPSLQEVLALM